MVKELFDSKGLPGFVNVFMKVIEKDLIQSGICCKHCNSDILHVHKITQRSLRTSLGIVTLDVTRFKCQSCTKTFAPLNLLLDLNPHERKSREFEKTSLETVVEQSFRRSSEHLERTLGFNTPHTTLHRWFMNGKNVVTSVVHRVQTLIADGTGYKMKPDENGSNRGEVKVVIGLTKDGALVPFGAWTEAEWKHIGKFIKKSNHHSEKVKFRPIAEVLVTDGEEGLVNAMKKLGKTHQRCLFHMTYEIDALLRYKDGASEHQAHEITKALSNLIYFDLPELGDDKLKNLEDKLIIEIKLKKVQKELEEFISSLRTMGYLKASGFVKNAKNQLYTYITDWIATGIENPRVTSLVERIMREIKRRIKKIGFGWSERGAEKMTRLVLLRLAQTKNQWEEFWDGKTGIDCKVQLTYLGTTVSIKQKTT